MLSCTSCSWPLSNFLEIQLYHKFGVSAVRTREPVWCWILKYFRKIQLCTPSLEHPYGFVEFEFVITPIQFLVTYTFYELVRSDIIRADLYGPILCCSGLENLVKSYS